MFITNKVTFFSRFWCEVQELWLFNNSLHQPCGGVTSAWVSWKWTIHWFICDLSKPSRFLKGTNQSPPRSVIKSVHSWIRSIILAMVYSMNFAILSKPLKFSSHTNGKWSDLENPYEFCANRHYWVNNQLFKLGFETSWADNFPHQY